MKLNEKLLLYIVTFGGFGLLSKKMPGTIFSVAATLISYLLPKNCELFYIVSIILFIIGVFVSQFYVEQYPNNKDPGFIVIDEVCAVFLGNAIVLQYYQYNHSLFILYFVLFRLFDIWKPFPIHWIEVYLRTKPKLLGFGIMIDDVIATIFASVSMWGLLKIGIIYNLF